VTGCFIRTTGGTGGGGTGGANNQARKIITYNTSTGVFTVEPNWETSPSTDTTYDVLLPEGVTLGMLKTINPVTSGGNDVNLASGSDVYNYILSLGANLAGMTFAAGFIPDDSSNDSTHVYLGLTDFGDDGPNNLLLVIKNNDNVTIHARWIEDYVESTGIAVVEALPWTPLETDEYWVYAIRRSATTIAELTAIRNSVHNGTVINGTADTGATTTSIPIKTSDVTPTVTDQWKGRVILFDKATATANLRGQGAPIDGNSTTHITLAAGDALTTAPAVDDVFRIV
jgi:hypothetical protein